MIIHTVETEETIKTIANKYGIPEELILRENSLADGEPLAVGEALIIPEPMILYTVKEGDTLASLSERFEVSITKIWQNNPILEGSTTIFPGQLLIIENAEEKIGEIISAAIAFEGIEERKLRTALPYLTRLGIYGYVIGNNGKLSYPNDESIISLAKEYEVQPYMVISSFAKENADLDMLLKNNELSEKLLNDISNTIEQKGYSGVIADIDFETTEDKELLAEFLRRLNDTITKEGKILISAIPPKEGMTEEEGKNADYLSLGEVSDDVILITYGYSNELSAPMPSAPLNKALSALSYAETLIPSDRILLGIPSYGIKWSRNEEGEYTGEYLSSNEARALAAKNGAKIDYDPITATAGFNKEIDGSEVTVLFEDSRSYDALLKLIADYDLLGASLLSLEQVSKDYFLILNSLYNIIKERL